MRKPTQRANPHCPYPERYKTKGWVHTEDVVTELIAAFARALQPDLVIETGAFLGDTSLAIAEALKRNGQGHLHTFETDPARFKVAAQKVRNMPVTVHPSELFTFVPDKEVRFAFFDSAFETRIKEFEYLRGWMPKGSIAAFHDTGPQWPVLAEVEKLEAVRVIYLPTLDGIAFAEVL